MQAAAPHKRLVNSIFLLAGPLDGSGVHHATVAHAQAPSQGNNTRGGRLFLLCVAQGTLLYQVGSKRRMRETNK